MQSFFKSPWNVILIFAVLVSFIYSLVTIQTQTAFSFDQARDAYEAFSIWHNHDVKILGPSSDIPGINHGVLWYYFLAALYFLGGGIPENAVMVLILTLYAFIPLVAYLTYKMSRNTAVTAVSMALYVCAPLFMAFTHWLSNPVLALFITPPLFYFLWQYQHTQTTLRAFLIGLFFALLIQSDFGFIILLLLLPLYLSLFRIRFSWKDTFTCLGGGLIGMASFFVAYIKFKTNFVAILSSFLGDSDRHASVGDSIIKFIDNLMYLLNTTYFALPSMLTFLILVVIGIRFRKTLCKQTDALTKLLLLWLSGIILIFVFNRGNLSANFFYAPFLYPLAVLVAMYFLKIIKHKAAAIWILIGLIVLQFITINQFAKNEESPLVVQKRMTLHNEKQAIDYIYASADNEPFVISTITNPLYINTTWSYLFRTYGEPKYGSVPYLWGRDQQGYLGDLPMQKDLHSPTLRYLIVESSEGIAPFWINKITEDEDLLSDRLEERHFGNISVQKRLYHPDKIKMATLSATASISALKK